MWTLQVSTTIFFIGILYSGSWKLKYTGDVRQSIVKTVDSTEHYFLYWPGRTHHTGFTMALHNCTAIVYFSPRNLENIHVYSLFSKFCTYQILTCTYFVYFKSRKELNHNRFVDQNILGASRLVHSDLRIYRISLFLLDWMSCLVSNNLQVISK